jgi:uncharacterized protein HemX
VSRAQVVSIGFRRSATQDLSHVGLAVVPRRRRGRWLLVGALVLGALASGAGVGYVVRDRAIAPAPPPVSVAPELAALRQQLEQARLGLRLADARSRELERQIDVLNQRLTESQDELAFFRKAREGKH